MKKIISTIRVLILMIVLNNITLVKAEQSFDNTLFSAGNAEYQVTEEFLITLLITA